MAGPGEWPERNEEARRAWERNAGFWDDFMGETGNRFHQELVAPAAERLLQPRPGEAVLEIACGAGLFARRLAELGARVTATDFSEAFLRGAASRLAPFGDQVTVARLDATDASALRALGEGGFDAVVCNMALMDMAALEPLAGALPLLLRPGGRFVFTVMHPCFNRDGQVHLVEEDDREGVITVTHSLKLSRYRSSAPSPGIGVRGQPVPHLYFHRTLSALLLPFLAGGLVLDALEEPAFSSEGADPRSLDARNLHEFPLVLACRMSPRP